MNLMRLQTQMMIDAKQVIAESPNMRWCRLTRDLNEDAKGVGSGLTEMLDAHFETPCLDVMQISFLVEANAICPCNFSY